VEIQMLIMTVVGARPQFIKAAVVSRALRELHPDKREVIIHTGQHYDANMSDVFFDELEIPKPAYHLGIGGGTHGQNTGRMLEGIEQILLAERPDWVLVYGDTDSTLAGALAAAKLHIPVAHVEAGLRSYNRRMPEEINRVLTDHVASLLLTPTATATRNLHSEGIPVERVVEVGDVMYDAALFYKDKAKQPAGVTDDSPFVLATIHRAENTDDTSRLRAIVQALNEIAQETCVVLPLHPRTRSRATAMGLDLGSITVLDPVGYLEMIWLLEHCRIVVTDSGGLQKEAFFFGKPCVITRDETEWVELVTTNWNVIAGADNVGNITQHIRSIKAPYTRQSIYGDGTAGKRVASLL
jgi:UDP-GlcNAc3NAcA epimerase